MVEKAAALGTTASHQQTTVGTQTALVGASQRDGIQSQEQIFALLYEELHEVAKRELRRRGSAIALGSTTLLHELYLNLQEQQGVRFLDRAHFLSYAVRAMRGLIIDYARSRQALKRGGAFQITSLTTNVPEESAECEDLQRVGEAVERLEAVESRLALVVSLKYFCGFSFADIAAMWNVSERTVQRDWSKARLFLYQYLVGHTHGIEAGKELVRDQSVSG